MQNAAQMNLYTRRNFIKRTVAAAGTAGFAVGCRRLQVTDRGDLSSGAIDGLHAKLKGRRYAEIRAGATQGPEKVGVTFGVSRKNASVRGHNPGRKQIVARSPVQAREPAQSTAKDDTARANSGTLSEHRREPMPTRCPRHFATQHAAFGAGCAPQRIDRNPLHSGEINDQAVRTSPSQMAVPAGPRCDFKCVTPRKLHRSQRILLARALHDDPRPPLRCCVPVKDPPRVFIGGIGGENQTSFEFGAQPVDSTATEVISIGDLKTPTAGGEPKCPCGGDRSFDEIASRVLAHLYSGPSCLRPPPFGEAKSQCVHQVMVNANIGSEQSFVRTLNRFSNADQDVQAVFR